MKPVRVARGTLPPVQVALPVTFAEASGPINVVAAPTLRMTLHPPRFTTTTPGVMRRQPR